MFSRFFYHEKHKTFLCLHLQPSEFGKKTNSKKMLLYMKIMTAKHKLQWQKHAVMFRFMMAKLEWLISHNMLV